METLKTILGLIGFFQIMCILIALAFALGKVSVINKWKVPDFFWINRMEEFFVKLFSK